MSYRSIILCGALTAVLAGCAQAPKKAAQYVDLLSPKDGAVVSSPVKIKFEVAGMEVKPAGEVLPNSGHHHLLLNLNSVKAGESIPFDDQHLHFGKGQTEATVALPPGDYKLTAQFANGAHQSYGAAMSKTIVIKVVE